MTLQILQYGKLKAVLPRHRCIQEITLDDTVRAKEACKKLGLELPVDLELVGTKGIIDHVILQ